MRLPIYSERGVPAASPENAFQGWTPSLSNGGGRGLSTLLLHPHKFVKWVALAARHIWRKRRYLTLLKLLNILLVSIQQRLKTEYVIGRPFQLSIEATNVCATKCALCPTGQRLTGRPKGTIGFDEYCRLINRCKRWIYTLNLFQWGDPLNAPRIYDMIRYAADAGIFTHVSTTLGAFHADVSSAEVLVRSGLSLLSCSFHGASDETFSSYQGNHGFSETVEKVRLIVAARNRLGSQTPKVQVHFVVMRGNEHEIDQFSYLARQLECTPVFSPASLNLRFLGLGKNQQPLTITADELEEKVRERIEAWLPTDPRFVLEPYGKIRRGESLYREFGGEKVIDCEWPWKAMVVNWDSKVAVCCGSWAPSQDIGDLSRESWAQVWNSPAYRQARRSFKQPAGRCGSPDVPCTNCPGSLL